MRVCEGKKYDKPSKVDHVWRKNRGKEGEGEDETIHWFGFGYALDFGAEPEEERWPKDEHDKRCARASKVEEGGRKDGENRGEEGDIGLEPAVQEKNQEKAEENAEDDAGEFNRID